MAIERPIKIGVFSSNEFEWTTSIVGISTASFIFHYSTILPLHRTLGKTCPFAILPPEPETPSSFGLLLMKVHRHALTFVSFKIMYLEKACPTNSVIHGFKVRWDKVIYWHYSAHRSPLRSWHYHLTIQSYSRYCVNPSIFALKSIIPDKPSLWSYHISFLKYSPEHLFLLDSIKHQVSPS